MRKELDVRVHAEKRGSGEERLDAEGRYLGHIRDTLEDETPLGEIHVGELRRRLGR